MLVNEQQESLDPIMVLLQKPMNSSLLSFLRKTHFSL